MLGPSRALRDARWERARWAKVPGVDRRTGERGGARVQQCEQRGEQQQDHELARDDAEEVALAPFA